jgi:hypothetical protein
MGMRTDTTYSDRLEPGDRFDCEYCGQSSEVLLNNSVLECGTCGYQIQDYDLVDHDRVPLDEDGRMSGRGAPVKLGKRPSRTRIGNPCERARIGKNWRYLDRVDCGGADGGATESKNRAIELIEWHARTKEHANWALDLLDICWPDRSQMNPNQLAIEEPIWKPAHPNGVGSAAAACLQLAAEEMGFDSKLERWAKLCLPDATNPVSFGFRSLKRMRTILRSCGRGRSGTGVSAGAILSGANLGSTIYGSIAARIWEVWLECTRAGDNLENHARPVLAAICHAIAVNEGMPVRPGLIQERFDVGRSYQFWIGRLGLY